MMMMMMMMMRSINLSNMLTYPKEFANTGELNDITHFRPRGMGFHICVSKAIVALGQKRPPLYHSRRLSIY